MIVNLRSIAALLGCLMAFAPFARGEPMTVDEFRRELVGMPLCGTPASGPLAGKMLCTVHLPDGTAIVAGQGMLVRGTWEGEGGRICRRNAHDPLERRRCIEYEKMGEDRYRNSDGIELCIGPCP